MACCCVVRLGVITISYTEIMTKKVDLCHAQWARKFEKVQAKKLVKSIKSKYFFS